MQAGLVSVVIPAYNARDTILDAVASVERQTYGKDRFEIIVVDDGSTDGTGEWVKSRYPNVRLAVLSNRGPSGARNHGISMACGEFVAFLDADDAWQENKIEYQIRMLREDPETGLVASDWIRGRDFPEPPPKVPVTWISYPEMLRLNRFQTSTVLMRHAVLEQLEGFDSSVDGAEDWDLWLRTSVIARIAKLDWPFVMYRDVPSGYSKDVWRVYETMQPMLEKHRHTAPVSVKEFAEIEAWHHLRFSVAFFLMHDQGHAWKSLNIIKKSPRLWLPTMTASAKYLIPFLWSRLRRRK
ncbi:MAG: glycosyltransferase family 2 protein [Sulfobacillus benefaciens]|uniref:Glycosyltransferase family 2 protein n=1 Tax=Sulfobacillus benefaciens TaxID=453960 RepID=A0A2T2WUD0_9FIRM|nr:MAG: glycosyltransferase family 2 protein [Sulfobacillus benefaciens]